MHSKQRLKANYKKKRIKKVAHFAVDTEVATKADSAPESHKPNAKTDDAIAYLIGVSSFNFSKEEYKLVASLDPLTFELCKSNPFIYWEGLYAAESFSKWLYARCKEYDEVNIYVYNLPFDFTYLFEYLKEEFREDTIDVVRKKGDDVLYANFKIGKATVRFHELCCIARKPLKSVYKTFNINKKEVGHYAKFMKFNERGEIEGYWTHKLLDAGFDEKGRNIEKREVKWFSWTDSLTLDDGKGNKKTDTIQNHEIYYLWYDVVPLYLVHLLNRRLKHTMIQDIQKTKKVNLTRGLIKYFYNHVNTPGNIFKFICNAFNYRYRDDWLIRSYFKEPDKDLNIIKGCGSDFDDSKYPDIYKAVLQPAFREDNEEQYRDQQISFSGAFTSGTNVSYWEASGEYPVGLTLDNNSQYPYVMREYMPVGHLTPEETPGEVNIAFYVCKFKERNGKVVFPRWKKKYAHIQNNVFGTSPICKYIKRNRTNECEFYIPERLYKLTELMCEDLPDVIRVMYKVGRRFLTETVDFLQVGKQEASIYKTITQEMIDKDPSLETVKAKEELRYEVMKITSNSGYGKACEMSKEGSTIWNMEDEEFIPIEDYYRSINKIYSAGEKYDLCSGMYIPAMGRTMILTAVMKLIDSGHKFLYADTDSLIFAVRRGLDPFEGLDIDSKRLGAWKFEGAFTKFRYPLKSKKYGIWFEGIKYPEAVKLVREWLGKNYTDKTDIKIKYSGVERSVMEDIAKQCPELLDLIYSADENVLIKDGGRGAVLLQGKKVFYSMDRSFNAGSYAINNVGERVYKGHRLNSAVLFKLDGKWVFKRNPHYVQGA